MRILGYRGKSWISKVIRWQTRSKYSHIAIELHDGSVVEAWHIGGVAHNRSFRSVHTKGTKVDVFAIEGMSDLYESAVRAFLMKQVGKKYDFGSIAKFLSRRAERHDNKWFCSELAMEGIAAGGVDLLKRIPASHVSPGQLVTSPLLQFIETRTA